MALLKKFGTIVGYPSPPVNIELTITVCICADDGRLTDHGKASFLCGIHLGPLQIYSPFNTLSWMSHKSRLPVKENAAAEILAVGEAIDKGKMIKTKMSELLKTEVILMVLLIQRFYIIHSQRYDIQKIDPYVRTLM